MGLIILISVKLLIKWYISFSLFGSSLNSFRLAVQRSQQDMVSVVQGHYHSESYIENYVGEDGGRRFAMQIGSGINIKEYAFAYGRHFAKPHVNVGIVINGKLPIIEFMDI